MRYTTFTIRNYRAITGPLVIDIGKKSLIPIIGINESGKTTILHALFAFDHYNDDLNDGRHLEDINNLYQTSSPPATIEAEVEISRIEMREALGSVAKSNPQIKTTLTRLGHNLGAQNTLRIQRELKTKEYKILTRPFDRADLSQLLAQEVIRNLPYILFFDDFRDKIEEKILIDSSKRDNPTGWLAILEQLFSQTANGLSLFDLPEMEERQRKSILAKVKRKLNETLTREWQNFRLDDRDALEISVDMLSESKPNAANYYLKLDIVERDANGDAHYFFISDRSKGFYWFFNFVMKLEFNPKVVSDDGRNTVYLLDEPGSYLHASAQSRLCRKLKFLSERNRVIYCTHSHYLLNPEVIPLSSIHVADKDTHANVSLTPIHEYHHHVPERLAFQPVLDALHIKPFLMDLSHRLVIIVEGIFDYYAMEMFRQDQPLLILPSVGADSIKYFASIMVAWQVKFRALWDADKDGRKAWASAKELFDSEHAATVFHLLPAPEGSKRIMQDLFDGGDLKLLREELGISQGSSFEKTIAAVFFSAQRGELLAKVSSATRANFEQLYASLNLE